MNLLEQNLLPEHIREKLILKVKQGGRLQEIRLRVGQPIICQIDGSEYLLEESKQDRTKDIICEQQDIDRILSKASEYSLYACHDKLRQGFLTLRGGHRIGISGQAVCEDGTILTIQYVSGLNIRVAHEMKGCARKVFPWLWMGRHLCSALIISPPGGGKTTLLRDLIRMLSNGSSGYRGLKVGVVDERSELAASYHGVAQNDMGIRTDILDGCPKSEGILCLIRSMSPQVIAVDEIGGKKDREAIERAMFSGCKMLCSVHGGSYQDVSLQSGIRSLIKKGKFERYILLADGSNPGMVRQVRDREGKILWEVAGECNGSLQAVY